MLTFFVRICNKCHYMVSMDFVNIFIRKYMRNDGWIFFVECDNFNRLGTYFNNYIFCICLYWICTNNLFSLWWEKYPLILSPIFGEFFFFFQLLKLFWYWWLINVGQFQYDILFSSNVVCRGFLSKRKGSCNKSDFTKLCAFFLIGYWDVLYGIL